MIPYETPEELLQEHASLIRQLFRLYYKGYARHPLTLLRQFRLLGYIGESEFELYTALAQRQMAFWENGLEAPYA